MEESASGSKPISFGRYVALYAILLYYVAFCSVFTIHFVRPFTLRVLHVVWLIFIDKRWNVLASLLCFAAFFRYIFFKSNKQNSTEVEDDLVDLPFPSSSSSMAFQLPSYPPLSPPPSLLSPPSSPHSSFTSPWSSPQSSLPSSFTFPPPCPRSSFTSPPSSLSSPWSSLQSSPRSAFLSSLSSPPPPPPFVMRPWKFNYVRMTSSVSLSSEDSGDSDIDIKAEKFIAQFRSRLNSES